MAHPVSPVHYSSLPGFSPTVECTFLGGVSQSLQNPSPGMKQQPLIHTPPTNLIAIRLPMDLKPIMDESHIGSSQTTSSVPEICINGDSSHYEVSTVLKNSSTFHDSINQSRTTDNSNPTVQSNGSERHHTDTTYANNTKVGRPPLDRPNIFPSFQRYENKDVKHKKHQKERRKDNFKKNIQIEDNPDDLVMMENSLAPNCFDKQSTKSSHQSEPRLSRESSRNDIIYSDQFNYKRHPKNQSSNHTTDFTWSPSASSASFVKSTTSESTVSPPSKFQLQNGDSQLIEEDWERMTPQQDRNINETNTFDTTTSNCTSEHTDPAINLSQCERDADDCTKPEHTHFVGEDATTFLADFSDEAWASDGTGPLCQDVSFEEHAEPALQSQKSISNSFFYSPKSQKLNPQQTGDTSQNNPQPKLDPSLSTSPHSPEHNIQSPNEQSTSSSMMNPSSASPPTISESVIRRPLLGAPPTHSFIRPTPSQSPALLSSHTQSWVTSKPFVPGNNRGYSKPNLDLRFVRVPLSPFFLLTRYTLFFFKHLQPTHPLPPLSHIPNNLAFVPSSTAIRSIFTPIVSPPPPLPPSQKVFRKLFVCVSSLQAEGEGWPEDGQKQRYVQLSREIEAYTVDSVLSQSEFLMRVNLIDFIWKNVVALNSSLLLCVTGSFTSYTSLPTSDVDIVLITPEQLVYIRRVQRLIRAIFQAWYGTLFDTPDGQETCRVLREMPMMGLSALGVKNARLCEICGGVLTGRVCDCECDSALNIEEHSQIDELSDDQRATIHDLLSVPLTPNLQTCLDLCHPIVNSTRMVNYPPFLTEPLVSQIRQASQANQPQTITLPPNDEHESDSVEVQSNKDSSVSIDIPNDSTNTLQTLLTSQRIPIPPPPTVSQDIIQQTLGVLHQSLLDHHIEAKFIASTKVPIVKLVDPSRGKADVSFGTLSGIVNTDYLRCILAVYPEARPLIVCLKAFLLKEGMNEPFRGGLGGYSISLMAISHLQLFRRNFGEDYKDVSLGRLLISFFELYGESETLPTPHDDDGNILPTFSCRRLVVSVRGHGQYLSVDKVRTTLPELFTNVDQNAERLIVEDPLDQSNNTTRSCYDYPKIKALFLNAFQVLSAPHTLPELSGEETDEELIDIFAGCSLLSRILALFPSAHTSRITPTASFSAYANPFEQLAETNLPPEMSLVHSNPFFAPVPLRSSHTPHAPLLPLRTGFENLKPLVPGHLLSDVDSQNSVHHEVIFRPPIPFEVIPPRGVDFERGSETDRPTGKFSYQSPTPLHATHANPQTHTLHVPSFRPSDSTVPLINNHPPRQISFQSDSHYGEYRGRQRIKPPFRGQQSHPPKKNLQPLLGSGVRLDEDFPALSDLPGG